MGGKDVDVNLDNIKLDVNSDTYINATMNSDSDIDLDMQSNSDIKIDTSNIRTELVLPQPFRTESRFAITEPIVTQSTSNLGLDIRPLVMDFCFKFEFGKLPSACIRQPYQHHFGITLFGMEVLGFNFAGESRIMIDEVQKRPQVAWGGEPGEHGHAHHREHEAEPGGLRIRLGS
jgi:hypothetical protein